jgi:hypothetical protein
MARLRIALLAALVVTAAGVLAAQDTPKDQPAPAGTWKISLPTLEETGGRPVLIVKLTRTGGKWNGEIAASALRGKSTLEKLSVSDKNKRMRFTVKAPTFTLPCEIKLPADRKTDKLYGETQFRKAPMPVEMERTTLTSLDQFDQNRDTLAREPLGIQAIGLALSLLREAGEKKVKPTEARAWAEKALKSAELYGPGVQRDVLLGVANVLGQQKGFETIALQYARRAERQLDEKEGPAAVKKVLGVLADVLEKAGKTDEAKTVLARVMKLDFRVKPKTYAGRKAKNDRVVLAEVFTSAQANPAVASDMATAALLKTFKPTEVAVIEYHLHFPQPDPLSCADAEERVGFYGKAVQRLPLVLLNGKMSLPGGGGPEDAQERYDDYVEAIEPLLEDAPKAELNVSATLKGGKVHIAADVSKVAVKGDDIRLRLVLVEPTVSYKGLSGQTIHHNVARAMPGTPEGVVIKGKTTKKSFTVDLADLRKKLAAYLDKVAEKRDFPDKERPMNLKKLRVIGFVQNDANGEVLQAVQADVKGP